MARQLCKENLEKITQPERKVLPYRSRDLPSLKQEAPEPIEASVKTLRLAEWVRLNRRASPSGHRQRAKTSGRPLHGLADLIPRDFISGNERIRLVGALVSLLSADAQKKKLLSKRRNVSFVV
jgi:hypothetical protein